MMHTCSYCEQPSRHDIHCVWETRWHGVVLCLRLHRFFYVRHAPPGRTQRVRWPTTKLGKSTCRPAGCMCVSFTMHRAVGGGRLAPSLCHPTRPMLPSNVTLRLPHCWCWVEAGMMQCSLALRIRLVALRYPEGRDHRICLVDPKDAHHAYPL